MKSAFSLLELIFAIVILGIVASFAIPKYIDTKDSALVSTIKRDLNTAVSSLQSYYLLNQKIEKISDVLTINDTNWTVSDTKISDKNSCVYLEVKTSQSENKSIEVVVDSQKDTTICKKIKEAKIVTASYELY
ncbi:type II secretion system protein [Arcobacter caeni]|jgi:general secretion pathway protein G|uniref:Prepilin-type N-terminal cleavage/methylation domain-containing protein n=1 Tax=Arcobacter caeni TaxID=1912877 RepID=A0A363D5S6_9BACT|nr:type II secretion system protein [Arcobacter caeni]MBY0540427.1 type II secretion system GspH family protein [Campylobacterales bacterium]PUE66671.1 prepilin-type N-terminal cleavage/methylation domain-containing protein [Arcobacter caeni]